MARKSKIRLRSGASIGEPAAEDDARFLRDCFVNHPTIEALKDVRSHQCLLLGRTGSGKSAILWHLEDTLDNVSRVNPKDVAFEYIGNSAIIKHLSDLGVDLHLLYEYLWTHVLTLHFTRECLGARSKDGLGRVIESIKNLVWRDEKRKIAIQYLEKHADDFWITVEQVSADFTSSVAEKLAREAGISPEILKAKIESGGEWKEEEKRQFKYRAQEIVSSLQMRELKEVITALSARTDSKQEFFILIDDLDRSWAGSDGTQYALIRALIETLKTFRRIPNLKIVVALREDLYEATLRTTTDTHFQAEKLDGIIKRIRWTDAMLVSLVEKRIHELFRHEYTKQTVKLTDVLPENVVQCPLRTYLIERTLRRPRDVIAFVNRILVENEGEHLPLPARAITKAEPGYSTDRLRALEDEWRSCHPLIRTYLKSIQGFAPTSQVSSLTEDKLFSLIFEVSELERRPADDVERIAKSVYDRDKELRITRLARSLTANLYKIGAIGLKLHSSQSYTYCYEQRASVEDSEIADDTKLSIHPMLATSLGSHANQADAA